MAVNWKKVLSYAAVGAGLVATGYAVGKSRGAKEGYEMASDEMPKAIREALVDLAEKNELVFVEEEVNE